MEEIKSRIIVIKLRDIPKGIFCFLKSIPVRKRKTPPLEKEISKKLLKIKI
jgi:hypothetical protein